MGAVYYTGNGTTLGVWAVDVAAGDLDLRSTVRLPAPAMYGWPSADRRRFYMTCSDGGPGNPGTRHFATAWSVGPAGDLTPLGEPVALPSRPIHASLDRANTHLLTCNNWTSSFTVHRIEPGGTIGALVPQVRDRFGVYAHQILTTPHDHGALLVCRGNQPTTSTPEDPGALHGFRYDGGRLTHRREIAPGGGRGFGPRHLDFHPGGQWVLGSIERQCRLQVYAMDAEGDLMPTPVCDVSTLERPEAGDLHQASGFIKVHPSGRFAYVSNRNFGRAVDGVRHSTGGEQTIAVFALAAATGQATPIQHADAGSYHLRNAGIDPTGRLLVASSIEPAVMPDGAVLPAGLAVLRIGTDGRLTLHKRIAMDVRVADGLLFWSGMVALP